MNMVIVWGIVAVVALLLEIATVGAMTSIWFAVGALIALVLALLKLGTMIQLIVFIVLSVASFIIIRPMAANYLRGNIVPTNYDSLIGSTVKVSKEITTDAWGEVTVSGMTWSAVEVNGKAVEAGSHVKVLAIEGAKLIVKKGQ